MGKFIDLSGQQFGDWQVLEYRGSGKWLCRCSCNNEKEVAGKSLRNGTSKSCGHDTANLKDISNQQFGRWKVLEYVADGKWLCQCQCKGKTQQLVSGFDLRSGKSTNCGCIRSEKIAARNSEKREHLENKTFNDWTVIEYVGDKHYKCKCSCGKIKIVASNDLKSGISKSCGHNNGKNKIVDITNKRFGMLVVKEYIGNKTWRCHCDCGNDTLVLKGNLYNGSTQSCGCNRNKRISKDDILEAIKSFKEENGELPFISDLVKILNRHEGHIRRYINEYELGSYINKTFSSRPERELFNLVDNAILHDRTVLEGQELDIYIPNSKLAIEFNGDYWHSTVYKNETYHQNKTLACAKKGIQLIHIFEHEWNDDVIKEKIINLINSKLDKNISRVYARDTEIREIKSDESKEFLNKYHLQNSASASIHLGCFHNNELIGVMTFGKPRFNQDYQYELIRLCWKNNLRVIGGLEKMFSYFVKYFNVKSIITYSDLSKFTGNGYTKIGFKPIGDIITKPNYKWVNLETGVVLNRYQTQKQKLVEMSLGTEDQTEDEIMISHGFYKIYDSGNIKMHWIKE